MPTLPGVRWSEEKQRKEGRRSADGLWELPSPPLPSRKALPVLGHAERDQTWHATKTSCTSSQEGTTRQACKSAYRETSLQFTHSPFLKEVMTSFKKGHLVHVGLMVVNGGQAMHTGTTGCLAPLLGGTSSARPLDMGSKG